MEKADTEKIYMDLSFPKGKNGRPYLVINMVTTVDGKATIAGRTKHIGSPFDRSLMRRVRAAADMVMIGSTTLRKEEVDFRMPDYLKEKRVKEGLPPSTLAATLTLTCDLPLNRRFFQDPEIESIVFTVESADKAKLEEIQKYSRIYFVGKIEPDLNKLMEVCIRDLGVSRIVLEGGPSLNARFIWAGLADEIFWTVAPKIAAGSGITMVQGPELPLDKIAKLDLVSGYENESELYLRYRFV